MLQPLVALLLAAGGPFKGSAPLNFPTVSSGSPALSLAQGASVNYDVNGVNYTAETPAGTIYLDGGLSVSGAAAITGATTVTGAFSASSSTLTGAAGCYTTANGCSWCPDSSTNGVVISSPADGGLGNGGQFTVKNFFQSNFDSTKIYGGVQLTKLGTPAITSVSNPVGDGGTTYCYRVTAWSWNGQTVGSTQVCDALGWNNLGAQPETISWPGVAHAQTYSVYRTSSNSDAGYGLGAVNGCDQFTGTSCIDNAQVTVGGAAPPTYGQSSEITNVNLLGFADGGNSPYFGWNQTDNFWVFQNFTPGVEFNDGVAGHQVQALPGATPALGLGTGTITESSSALALNQPANVTGGVSTTLHMLSKGSSPTVGSFAGCLGTGPSASATTGGEFAGILNITTGSGTSNCTAGTAIFTVTLPTGYASSSYVVLIQDADTPPAPNAGTSYAGIPSAATTFVVYNIGAFTPTASTMRHWQYMTAGAGVAN